MKANKIIVGVLVLIGFGSCCNRPSKSKPVRENPEEAVAPADTASVRPIMVMYGPPRQVFSPEKLQDAQTIDGSSAAATEETEAKTTPKEK